MRVLVSSNLYPPDVLGGFELACAQVVDALIDRGHEVQVLSARPRQVVSAANDPPHVHRRFDFVDEWSPGAIGRHPVAIRLKLAKSRVVNAFNVHVLTEAIREFSPDVIYVNNLVGLGGIGLVATLQFLNVPWVWHLGDYVPKELCSTPDGLIPGLAGWFAKEIRGTFAVVSGRVRDECHEGGLKLNGRVELIPYWITGDRPAPRERFYRPGDPLRIMSAGRVDSQKGGDVLIETAHRLRQQGFDRFTIDVFGKVADPTFPGLIRSLGLEGVVKLHGPRPHREILELYPKYDLFLFPTRSREPFGLVPLEAAARGCVPLISHNCGVAEWLVNGVHCLKAARNAEAFANAIRKVLSGETRLEPIAHRAAEAAWRDFHLDTVLPGIESLLLEASSASFGVRSAGSPLRIARDDTSARSPGTASEAYRLARMAEHLSQLLIQDALSD